MNNDLKNLLKEFCDKYSLEYYNDVLLIVVEDISEYVRKDDLQYYSDKKEALNDIYGLLYEDSSGNWNILLKDQDKVNFYMTLIHEYVHFGDYKKLSNWRKNTNLRELENDFVFLFWTEFHATYMSYKELIGLAPKKIDIKSCQSNLVADLVKYCSFPQLDVNKLLNNTCRSYGQYWALHDAFPLDVPLYPRQYYLDKTFLDIYKFLGDNKSFDNFVSNYCEFEKLLQGLNGK